MQAENFILLIASLYCFFMIYMLYSTYSDNKLGVTYPKWLTAGMKIFAVVTFVFAFALLYIALLVSF